MSKTRDMVCIICPNGCRMQVTYDRQSVEEVRQALCPKGKEYARDELFRPMRTLTTTVRVVGGALPLVSVRSNRPLPREKMQEAVKLLGRLCLNAPVAFQQVIVEDILDTGADIIATRENPQVSHLNKKPGRTGEKGGIGEKK